MEKKVLIKIRNYESQNLSNRTLHKTNSEKRDAFFDIVKSYAIFLVVLGHVIQTFDTDWENNHVFLAIYMFHMPLFAWVSGRFFIYSANKYSLIKLFKKRFVNLMLPSLTMGVFNFLLIGGGKLLRHEIIDFDYSLNLLCTGLWFLTVLFVMTIIGKSLYDKCRGLMYYCAWFIVWGIIFILPDFWVLNQIEYLLPFFVGGMIFRNVKIQRTNIVYLMVASISYIMFLNFYTFEDSMYNMGDDVFCLRYLEDTFLRIVCGCSGIMLSLYILRASLTVCRRITWFEKLGLITLPIYVLHQKILMLNRLFKYQTENILILVVIATVVIALTIATYRVLHKNKVIAFALFGEFQNK